MKFERRQEEVNRYPGSPEVMQPQTRCFAAERNCRVTKQFCGGGEEENRRERSGRWEEDIERGKRFPGQDGRDDSFYV